MKKTGQQLYWNLSESISRENNSSTNLEAIFTTLALLAVELGADEFQVDLIRYAMLFVCLPLIRLGLMGGFGTPGSSQERHFVSVSLSV